MSRENNSAKDIEGEISAALKRLNEVQSPAGITARIHRSLEIAATTAQQPVRTNSFWIPATCVAIATVLLVVLLQTHLTREKQISKSETAKMVMMDSASLELAPSQPRLIPAKKFTKQKLSATHFRSRSRWAGGGKYHHVANLFAYPMTRQEKLLVKFLEIAKPADLDALNPEYQAKIAAQREADAAADRGADSISDGQ